MRAALAAIQKDSLLVRGEWIEGDQEREIAGISLCSDGRNSADL